MCFLEAERVLLNSLEGMGEIDWREKRGPPLSGQWGRSSLCVVVGVEYRGKQAEKQAGKTGVAKNGLRLKWEKEKEYVKQAREKKRVGF